MDAAVLDKNGQVTNGKFCLVMLANGMTIFCEEMEIHPDHSIEFDPRRALMVEFINKADGKGVRTVKFASTLMPSSRIWLPASSIFQMQNITDPTILDGFRGNLSGLVLAK